ncbi:galactose oxidase [Medicago truncatula]|uniref:Galactose oxidase n=1 Tax=Medicago truncatula TaxID=3880 RepID=G7JDC9_MEDTR|nr:galactose oxidase [Medicago truncatula]
MVESSEEKKKKTTTLPYLPHELIFQILLRLPVKSLTRFKSVRKSWFSLISAPHFANSHFQLTSAKHAASRIMFISTLSHETRSIDFKAFLNDDDPASLNITFSLTRSHFPVEIRGSCRGFILLYRPPDIYIWNPSTGFKKHIHLSPVDSKSVAQCQGFGYDQSRDDYLVVSLSYNPSAFSTHLKFFSVRDNTWKEIEGNYFPYGVLSSCREGLLFNGVIHWLALRRDLEHQDILVYDNDKDTLEIWVMKEYKVHSSWNKTLVLSVDAIPDHYFHPIHSTKNGDIIGRTLNSRLVKYNDKGQLLRHRTFFNSPSEVVMYTESLLSLPGDNEQV